MSKTFNRRGVVKEFLGKIIRAIGKKKGANVAKQMMHSPEMKKIVKKSKELADEMEIDLRKKAKKDPDYWGPILKAYLAQK